MKQTKKHHRYTKEEINFIKDNYKNYYTPDLVAIFNKKFNSNINENALMHIKCRYNLKSGLTGMRKGIHKRTPEQIANLMKARYEKCGAKVGHKCKCGKYNYIKIKDDKFAQDNYMLYGRYIWEQYYGKIPDGYEVIHMDGDTLNDNINNLKLVKKNVRFAMDIKGIRTKNKKLNELAIMIVELQKKAKQKDVYNIEKLV